MSVLTVNRISKYLPFESSESTQTDFTVPPNNNNFDNNDPPNGPEEKTEPQQPFDKITIVPVAAAFATSALLAVGAHTTNILDIFGDTTKRFIQLFLNTVSLALGTFTTTKLLTNSTEITKR